MVIDYYEILCLPRTCTTEDIKKSFKSLALKHHPDKNASDSDKFKLISEAYHVLVDPEKRSIYDMTSNFSDNSNFLSSMLNILKNLMNAKMRKKKELELRISVTLDELYRGETKKIKVRVKRQKQEFESILLFVSLINYDRDIIFEKMGDEDENGNRLNIRILLDIKDHDEYYIDSVISKYDIINKNYNNITLYEFYKSKNLILDYLDNEQINITTNFNNIDLLVIKVAEKGLLYIKDESIVRGDLFIYFKLKLPDSDNIPAEILEKYFDK
jgi:DnaJ-class molecular chaperone